jgi:hypothetical protein
MHDGHRGAGKPPSVRRKPKGQTHTVSKVSRNALFPIRGLGLMVVDIAAVAHCRKCSADVGLYAFRN